MTGPPSWHAPACSSERASVKKDRLHVARGLDLSRKRTDVCLLTAHGGLIDHVTAPSDGDGFSGLARRVAPVGDRCEV
jgi:hypothetical protein